MVGNIRAQILVAKLSQVFLQSRYLICKPVPYKSVVILAFPRRYILNWRKSKCTAVFPDCDADMGQKFLCLAATSCHSVYYCTD